MFHASNQVNFGSDIYRTWLQMTILIYSFSDYSNFFLVFNFFFRNCGVHNPSWSELRCFVNFLNHQLRDCENSDFCNITLTEDTLEGFRTFVVAFMIIMSKVSKIREKTLLYITWLCCFRSDWSVTINLWLFDKNCHCQYTTWTDIAVLSARNSKALCFLN